MVGGVTYFESFNKSNRGSHIPTRFRETGDDEALTEILSTGLPKKKCYELQIHENCSRLRTRSGIVT